MIPSLGHFYFCILVHFLLKFKFFLRIGIHQISFKGSFWIYQPFRVRIKLAQICLRILSFHLPSTVKIWIVLAADSWNLIKNRWVIFLSHIFRRILNLNVIIKWLNRWVIWNLPNFYIIWVWRGYKMSVSKRCDFQRFQIWIYLILFWKLTYF